MPDQEPRTGGVRSSCPRALSAANPTEMGTSVIWNDSHGCFAPTFADGQRATHIARPVPEDEARDAVIAAAREMMANEPGKTRLRDWLAADQRVRSSLDRLDALDAT